MVKSEWQTVNSEVKKHHEKENYSKTAEQQNVFSLRPEKSVRTAGFFL